MSPLRVTMVSYDADPPLGGQGAVVAGMSRALRERGVELTSVAGRGPDALSFPSVLRRPPLDLSLWLNRHPEELLRADPQVVHLHGGPGGVLLLRRLPVPLVCTAHHTYRQAHPRGRPQRLLSPLEARCYRAAQLVLPVSASTASAVRELGVPAQRIEVLPPGIVAPAELDESRRDPGRLLFVGRLEPEKGVLDALTVMRRLIGERPEVSAAIIGRGSLEGRVRGAAAGAERLEVLGAVSAPLLREQYGRAAVVLMPSRFEGLGLVALEAMGAGVVVAGYDVDGLRDAVGAAGGGLLVEPGSVPALLEACRRLLEPGLRGELAARGRAHVIAQHSWDRVGGRLLELQAGLASG